MGKYHSITYEEKVQFAADLTGYFEKCFAHFTEYSPTVIRPYDSYVLMACQIYWELWLETSNNELFWKASILLSNALRISPASYNLRLLLIKFLNQIGKKRALFKNEFKFSTKGRIKYKWIFR